MTKAYINKVCSYIPETKVENQYLENLFKLPQGWIEERSGIKGPRGMLLDYSGFHPELEITKRIFSKFIKENSDFDLQKIDCIITAGSQHTCNEPVGFVLANENKLNNPMCFQMSTGCTGALAAIEIAKNYILSGKFKNIMIINAEILCHSGWSSNEKQSKTQPLFGEAASLMILSDKKEGFEIGDILTKVDTSTRPLWESLEPPNEGETFYDSFINFNEDFKKMSNCQKISVNAKFGSMDGKGVYMFLSRNIPDLLDHTLLSNNLLKDDINWFIPHQANKIINDGLAQRYNIPSERHVTVVQDTANISSAGCIVALSNINEKIKENENILLFAFGVGMFGMATTLKKV